MSKLNAIDLPLADKKIGRSKAPLFALSTVAMFLACGAPQGGRPSDRSDGASPLQLETAKGAEAENVTSSAQAEVQAQVAPVKQLKVPIENAVSKFTAQMDHSSLNVTFLQGEVLSSFPSIREPGIIRAAGDNLWIRDFAGGPSLHQLNRLTGELLYSGARIGDGPTDFVAIQNMEVYPPLTDTLWIFDSRLQRITSIADSSGKMWRSHIRLPKALPGQFVRNVVFTARDRFVAISYGDSIYFSLFTPEGEILSVDSYPLLGDSSTSERLRLHASANIVFPCGWYGKGFLIAYGNAGRVEFYDGGSRDRWLFSVPYSSTPEFTIPKAEKGVVVPNRSQRSWYRGCLTYRNHALLLFSGRSHAATFDNDIPELSEFIHVFSGNGQLAAVLRLSQAVSSVAIDDDAEFLYGVSLMGSQVYRFGLPAELQKVLTAKPET